MKVLLAAGIFFPDVGGPAIHVREIANSLVKNGFQPIVIAYGDNPLGQKSPFIVKRISRNHHKIIQWFLYFLVVFKGAIGSKVVYAFDPTAAGLPAFLVAWILRKPFLIRIGGDPIWEREAESGHRVMPIVDYYNQSLYKVDRPILYKLIKTVLHHSTYVVFYNQFWKDFYIKYFNLLPEKILIVKNPVFRRESANQTLSSDPVIIFAGRFVTYKNLPLVMKAFNEVRQNINKGRLILIGKGPEEKKLHDLKISLESGQYIEFIESLPQEKLFKKIKESAVAIGPALSEFNPNFILEALSFGKPVLLSRGHGLSVDLPAEFIFNPLNQKELEDKLLYLLESNNYRQAVDMVTNLDLNQSWEKVLDFHLKLINQVIK